MKKCYSLLRWPCLLQDVLNRRLLFKTNRQQWALCENHHPSFLVSGNWAEEKPVDAAKIVAAQKMLLKQKPSKHS